MNRIACLILISIASFGLHAIPPAEKSRSNQTPRPVNSSFIADLDAHGYFSGLAPDEIRTLKEEFLQKGWLAIFSNSHRFYLADAEELAEGGIGAFLRSVEKFLSSQRVKLPELSEEYTETGYKIRLGDRTRVILTAADMTSNRPGWTWGAATVRGFAIVDELLQAAGSYERLYAVNGGNDLFAMFLTPELYRIISAHPNAIPSGGPYKPKEDYPAFGQPSHR